MEKASLKITAINGSPRGRNGNTYIMVEEFLTGARDAGALTEHILLADKKIHNCIGCFTCWTKTPGVCVFKDDAAPLLSIFESDIVVFATPLYVDNVSGLMKNFFDRLIPLGLPYFEMDENGESRHLLPKGTKVPRMVVISNCGFPEQTHFEVLKVLFRRMARNFHTEVIAEIYRGEGEMLKVGSIFLKPILYKYKKLLQRCGREIVESGALSAETKLELEKPLIPYKSYLDHANKHWDEELAKLKNKCLGKNEKTNTD